MGRFGETAMWMLATIGSERLDARSLLAEVRSLDGDVGPGTLVGTLARLEGLGILVADLPGRGAPAYRVSRRVAGWPQGSEVD